VRSELRGALLRGAGAQLTEAGWSKNELSCDDLASITKLTFGPVWSLAGLEALSGLVELKVRDVEDGSLAPIVGRKSLRSLWIGPELESLSVNPMTSVTELTPLAGLSALEELVLRGARPADVAALRGLTSLRKLDLSQCHVRDLSPLAGLVHLRELHLSGNVAQSAAPLARMGELETLDLGGNGITDVAPLAGLVHLRELDLSENPVESVDSLAGLAELEVLNLRLTKVKDVSALTALPKLKTLWLCASPADLVPRDVLAAFARKGVKVMHGWACRA
jgi:internalin A